MLRGRDRTQDTVQSPLYWTAGNTLPFDLTVGQGDSPRAIKGNQRMFAMLRAQPAAVAWVEEAGRDHFQTHTALRSADDGWYARLAAMVALHSPPRSAA